MDTYYANNGKYIADAVNSIIEEAAKKFAYDPARWTAIITQQLSSISLEKFTQIHIYRSLSLTEINIFWGTVKHLKRTPDMPATGDLLIAYPRL